MKKKKKKKKGAKVSRKCSQFSNIHPPNRINFLPFKTCVIPNTYTHCTCKILATSNKCRRFPSYGNKSSAFPNELSSKNKHNTPLFTAVPNTIMPTSSSNSTCCLTKPDKPIIMRWKKSELVINRPNGRKIVFYSWRPIPKITLYVSTKTS